MSKQALTLAQKCFFQRLTLLDLGRCELIDFDFIEDGYIYNNLKECTQLHTLILSNEWWEYKNATNDWWNYENSKIIKSQNHNALNKLRILPAFLIRLKNLSVLICGGDGYGNREITDIPAVLQLTNLSYLDLSYNKITDISGITQLNKLRKLDLRGN